MEINITDFSEETYYVAECPKCKNMIESHEDPEYEVSICCDSCDTYFDIVSE